MSRMFVTFVVLTGAILMACQAVSANRSSRFPIYPEEAAENCIEGYVKFRYRLDEDRMVTDFEILESDPPGVFDEATRKNVEMYQYKEIYRGGIMETYLEYVVDEDCIPSDHNPSLNPDAGKADAG